MLRADPWTYYTDWKGENQRHRLVKVRWVYSKYPWLFPSKCSEGQQFNNENAVPLKHKDPEDAVRSFDSVNAMIHGVNAMIARHNAHRELRKEMGITK